MTKIFGLIFYVFMLKEFNKHINRRLPGLQYGKLSHLVNVIGQVLTVYGWFDVINTDTHMCVFIAYFHK